MDSIKLNTIEYTVELWDINNVFVADITALVATSLRISMPLNDVDELSFALDLVQFEKYCESIGARPINILEPYRTDVKIRRNGNYLMGAHVVETRVNFNNGDTNKIEVQCTGYLNHFKDRYLSAHYSQMTYAQIARAMITDTQAAYNQIDNGDFYEGISGWRYIDSGFIIWNKLIGRERLGALFVSNTTGPNTFGGARWAMTLQAGVQYTITYWVQALTTGAQTYIQTQSSAQLNLTTINSTNWTQVTYTWTPTVTSNFIDIKMNGNVNFYIDDVKLSDNIDNAARRNFGVTLGTDFASTAQQSDRVRNYDLQNVKDGLINLTKLENDKFDFKFDANKVFTVYNRLGSDKAEIELVYPQNIESINTIRTATKLANKIIALGAGIGEERLETNVVDFSSATTYRVREATEMFNSVEILNTLRENAFGALDERRLLNDNIGVTVTNNVLDLDEVELGDAIYIRVDNSSYVDYVNGLYRIVRLNIDVNQEFDEKITLELEKWGE